MAKIFSADVLKVGGFLLSGSGAGAALYYNNVQLAQGGAAAQSSLVLTAGSGLQGGGDLTANRRFDIGAGSGISVHADDINIDAGGVITSMISDGAVTNAKIPAGAAIEVNKLQYSGINFTYANGLTGSLTTNLGQTNNVTVTLDSNTLSAGGNNTLRVLKTSGALSQATSHAGINTFSFDGSSSVQVSVDNTVVRTSGAQTIAGNKTFSNNVIVDGNLTVNGTTTAVNSNEVNIGDNKIILNSDATTSTAADGGFQVYTGLALSPELLWSQTDRKWTISNDGSNYFEIISSRLVRAGTTSLAIADGSAKVVLFGYTFPSTPVVTATLKGLPTSDLIGWQINDVTTTGVGFDFTTSIPADSTYTLHWHAHAPISS